MIDQDEPGTGCPRMNMAPCVKGACRLYVELRGSNPNTGEPASGKQCVDVWQVLLQVEANQEIRQLGAAIESFRNEMVNSNTAAAESGAALAGVLSLIPSKTAAPLIRGQ